uniref:Pentraxin-4-like n=1 Tax=Podarcis muralis TaxID=64176 RepID=A0A670KEX3_PODMU
MCAALGMLGTRKMLSVFIILAAVCLQGTLVQQPGTAERRKLFFERFRRLEEQFRRFQEVTLTRLQEIAGNYNVSYNIDAKFEQLLSKHQGLESAANESHAATQEELSHLKALVKKLQNKGKKQDSKLGALEEALRERDREKEAEVQQERALLANLTQEVESHREDTQAVHAGHRVLQKALESLQDALKSQGSKLDELEQQLKNPAHNEVLLPNPLTAAQLLNRVPQEQEPEAAGGQNPTVKKLHGKHRQRKKLLQESTRLAAQSRGLQSGPPPGQEAPQRQEAEAEQPHPPEPQALRQQQAVVDKAPEEQSQSEAPRKPGTICNVDSMLFFPNASTENFATFTPGFQAGLLELSLCSWVSTSANYLGTILSYATEDNDNKLVLHGRDAAPRNSIHFVIGDPAFRELPVGRILDGKWPPHLCHLVLHPGAILVLCGQEVGFHGLQVPEGLRDSPQRVSCTGSGTRHNGWWVRTLGVFCGLPGRPCHMGSCALTWRGLGHRHRERPAPWHNLHPGKHLCPPRSAAEGELHLPRTLPVILPISYPHRATLQ